MIDQQAVEEFKALYKKEYKIQLTDPKAMEYGTRLVQLVMAVYGNNLPKIKAIDIEAKQAQN